MVMLPGGGVCYRGAIPIAEEMAKWFIMWYLWLTMALTRTSGNGIQINDLVHIGGK